MNEKDEQFFKEHWEEWVERHPPPDSWTATKKQWAWCKMFYEGFWGRILFWL